jgi:SAM-dependent methyltransferase
LQIKYNAARIVSMRNFYGTAWVFQVGHVRSLYNGRINHGGQLLDRPTFPTGYYSEGSGVGRVLAGLAWKPKLTVGIVGLGVGTLAAYGHPGQDFVFYELDPKVEVLANQKFSYLRNCQAQHQVVKGDARLSLELEPDAKFDLLIVDAFTGDAIPMHLLTAEAFQIYSRVLKPGGLLAFHVSNLYIDLPQVVETEARQLGRSSLVCHDEPHDQEMVFPSDWSVVLPRENASASKVVLQRMGFVEVKSDRRVWTDDDFNLLGALRPDGLPEWLRACLLP